MKAKNTLILLFLMSLLAGCGKNDKYAKDSQKKSQLTTNENKRLVDKALEALSEGQIIRVNEVVDDYCGGIDANYSLLKSNNSLKILMKLFLEPDTGLSSQGFREGVSKTRACIPQIKNFFSKYSVDFDLKFSTSEPSYSDIDNVITLTSKDIRSNSLKFSLKDPDYCRMVLHEVSHHLGLRDEYYEPNTCRSLDRASKDKDPYSLMDTIYEKNLALFPRHFLTILGPVYDKVVRRNFPYESKVEDFGQEKLLITSKKSKSWWDRSQSHLYLTSEIGLKSCYLRSKTFSESSALYEIKEGSQFLVQYDKEKIRSRIGGNRSLSGKRKYFYTSQVSLKFLDDSLPYTHLDCLYVGYEAGWTGIAKALKKYFRIDPVQNNSIAEN